MMPKSRRTAYLFDKINLILPLVRMSIVIYLKYATIPKRYKCAVKESGNEIA